MWTYNLYITPNIHLKETVQRVESYLDSVETSRLQSQEKTM